MDTVTLGNILDIANKLTVVALLVIIIYGGKNQWWVWGWQYRQVLQDSGEWKQMALRLLSATQRTVAAGERTTSLTEQVVQSVIPDPNNIKTPTEVLVDELLRSKPKTGG